MIRASRAICSTAAISNICIYIFTYVNIANSLLECYFCRVFIGFSFNRFLTADIMYICIVSESLGILNSDSGNFWLVQLEKSHGTGILELEDKL